MSPSTLSVADGQLATPALHEDPLSLLRAGTGPNALGLEVGAHTLPLQGVTPYYTDLVTDFAGVPSRADFLADAAALPLPDDTLDYLCSSHVLEHLPDPIRALYEWHRVLKPNGLLYLVVPDKRFTFDAPRPVTPVDHLIRDFVQSAENASLGEIDEFVLQSDWQLLRPHCPKLDETRERHEARADYQRRLDRGERIDIHYHTFTAESLAATIKAAGLCGVNGAGFQIISHAERYPPERRDGIGLLLRKRGRIESELPDTFVLTHANPAVPVLPIVSPLTLRPLQYEQVDGRRRLVDRHSGRGFRFDGNIPCMVPVRSERPRRPWSRRSWRMFRVLRARFSQPGEIRRFNS